MKAALKTALIVAGILVLAGAVLFAAAFLLGARPASVWNGGLSWPFGVRIGASNYRDWQNEYSPDGRYSLPADGIRSISIDWPYGEADVSVSGDGISFSENAASEATALRWGVEDGTLYIQYCAPGASVPASGKTLTLRLPGALAEGLDSFSFDGASADLSVGGISADSFSFNSSSGRLKAADIVSNTVLLSSSSGDMSFSGEYSALAASSSSGRISAESTGSAASISANSSSSAIFISGKCAEVSAESASGSIALDGDFSSVGIQSSSGKVSVASATCPGQLSVETSSGGVRLTLPADSGFTLSFESASGEMDCELPLAIRGDTFICGDGSGKVSVDTSSGGLTIKQG